jgi:hypothetical protein
MERPTLYLGIHCIIKALVISYSRETNLQTMKISPGRGNGFVVQQSPLHPAY